MTAFSFDGNRSHPLSADFQSATKSAPCVHCGKPDWCYSIGALTVCKRQAEPATGWEATSKSDGDGTLYYAPIQPKKSTRSASNKDYYYPDRNGQQLVKVSRIDDGLGQKKFWQSHWDGQQWIKGLPKEIAHQVPIYRYHQVKKAIATGRSIFLVEGEGCADSLWNIGLAATTTIGGSGKYYSYGSYAEDLTGADLVLCPDRDEPGLKHMERIAQDFPNARWVYAPPGDFYWQHLPKSGGLDISDWIADGATSGDICKAIKNKWSVLVESLSDPSNTGKLVDPKEKTIGDLEAEIIAAATSTNPKLALTQCAACNGFPASLIEEIAKSLLQKQGLHDLEKTEYVQCIEQFRDIELKIADPGERAWKLQALARKYRRTENQLRESYCKSLIAQHLDEPVTLKQLKELYGESREWIIRGWIPKSSLVLLHAQGGTGKTLFTNHLIKHITSGQDWDEYRIRSAHKVLYIQTDTDPINLIESLNQVGLTDDAPLICHTKWRIEHINQLYAWVQKYRPSLVVVDSLTTVSANSTINENEVWFAKPILYMGDVAKEFGCSFLLIHHSNSEGGARGTKAVRNAVDEVWRLEAVDPKNPTNPERILAMEKSRSRMPMRYKLKFDDDNYSWEMLGPNTGEEEEGPQQNSSARWLIVNHLEKHRGVRFGIIDLAEALRIPDATVRRELPGLFREGLIDRQPNLAYSRGPSGKGKPKHFYLISS